jgi:prepilin-type N-terminal cleavage/methylation domain-containing protein
VLRLPRDIGRSRSDAGFTLIELVVAICLLAIIIALITTALVKVLDSSSRANERAKAQRAAVTSQDLLQDDLRAARAYQRDTATITSVDELRDDIYYQLPTAKDIHDISLATSKAITFEADVFQGPGAPRPECVRWYQQPDYSIIREVHDWTSGCSNGSAPGTLRQKMVMMPKPVALPLATTPPPVGYRLMWQRTRNATDPDPANCFQSYLTGAAAKKDVTGAAANLGNLSSKTSRARLDAIVGVVLDLRAWAQRSKTSTAHGDQELVAFATIASRESPDYHYGLACVS